MLFQNGGARQWWVFFCRFFFLRGFVQRKWRAGTWKSLVWGGASFFKWFSFGFSGWRFLELFAAMKGGRIKWTVRFRQIVLKMYHYIYKRCIFQAMLVFQMVSRFWTLLVKHPFHGSFASSHSRRHLLIVAEYWCLNLCFLYWLIGRNSLEHSCTEVERFLFISRSWMSFF